MRRLASRSAFLLVLALGAAPLARAQDDEPERPKKKKKADPEKKDEDAPKTPEEASANLAPEARLCLKIARGDVIRGISIEPYIDLLTDGNTAEWNAKRKRDGGKLLDLAGRTWDTKGRDDLDLKLEGLDLQGADLSNVLFSPRTSFRMSDLRGATFRGSCIEGVEFASVWPFFQGARSKKSVRSTCLADVDLRDTVWTWCTALERTARRAYEDGPRLEGQNAWQRRQMERQRRIELLQRLQAGFGGMAYAFAFADMEGVKADKDSEISPLDDADEQQIPLQLRRSRTLEKLIQAARSGTVERAIAKLADRRRAARTKECPNPLRAEPALAEAIAACDSRLTGIATWKAVKLVEMAGRDPTEEATIVGAPDELFVVDDERAVSAARLLVSQGPILAWCKGVLPTTFSASAIVFKDQAYTNYVVHGHPVLALSDPLKGDRARQLPMAGTFHSEVVIDVSGVENLSLADAEKRTLLDSKLRDYAQAQGDDLHNQPVFEPTKSDEGTDPEKTLPEDVRAQIASQIGKNALAGMKCFKLAGQKVAGNLYYHVLSNDPKAILVVDKSFQSQGSIYSEGPVVFLGKNANAWIQRCVTKSWLAVKGQPQVGQFVSGGNRVDVEEKVQEEKPQEEKPEKDDGGEKEGR